MGWLERAIAQSEQRAPSFGRGRVLVGACLIAQEQGAFEKAEEYGQAGLQIVRELGDVPATARALALLGNLPIARGDLDLAQSLHDEALALFQELNNAAWIAVEHVNLAVVAYKRGNLDSAAAAAGEGLAIARQIGDDWDGVLALGILGDVAGDRGEFDQAGAYFQDQLELALRRRNQTEIANALSGFGGLAAKAGENERAARLLGAAESLYRNLGVRVPPPARPGWQVAIDQVQSELSPELLAKYWGTITLEEAIAEAQASQTVGETPVTAGR